MIQFDLETNPHAFGDGSHPTTAGCLHLMAGLPPQHNVLDMGCGSGILALTAAKVWQAEVLAVDIDPQAVELTQRNALANQLGDAITTHRSDGYSHGMIAARAPYDTVLCNVLAEPVIRWAPTLASSLKERGFAIVSGMLAWQVEAVEAAHVANGLSRITAVQQGDWVTLLLYKDAQ